MRDGHQSETRVFKPDTPPSSGPRLIALLLGGGFTIGSSLQLVPIARALASIYSAVVVTLSYRRAPEHDTWDSAQWLAQHAPTEVGADLAIVTAHRQTLKEKESKRKHQQARRTTHRPLGEHPHNTQRGDHPRRTPRLLEGLWLGSTRMQLKPAPLGKGSWSGFPRGILLETGYHC